MSSERTLPLDLRLFATLEDLAGMQSLDPGDEAVVSLVSVFLYDRNEVTHLCEITPSYCCFWLYDYVRLKDDGDGLTDREIDRLQTKYEGVVENRISYFHCYDIEKWDGERARSYVVGEQTLPEDVSYEDALEGHIEYFRGNQVL